jgi:microcompartment protein CcmL/EutN
MERSIGVVEFRSIAVGIDCVDKAAKASDVRIIEAKTICPGKYYLMFSGLVDAVINSMAVLEQQSKNFIIDSVVIANVYPQLFAALTATTQVEKPQSIGVIETLTSPSIIWAADSAIKATDIDLVEIRIARALGGKNLCVLNGKLSDVTESVRVATLYAMEKDFLVSSQVIASPSNELYRAIL